VSCSPGLLNVRCGYPSRSEFSRVQEERPFPVREPSPDVPGAAEQVASVKHPRWRRWSEIQGSPDATAADVWVELLTGLAVPPAWLASMQGLGYHHGAASHEIGAALEPSVH
jgi:hypothetical protein